MRKVQLSFHWACILSARKDRRFVCTQSPINIWDLVLAANNNPKSLGLGQRGIYVHWSCQCLHKLIFSVSFEVFLSAYLLFSPHCTGLSLLSFSHSFPSSLPSPCNAWEGMEAVGLSSSKDWSFTLLHILRDCFSRIGPGVAFVL